MYEVSCEKWSMDQLKLPYCEENLGNKSQIEGYGIRGSISQVFHKYVKVYVVGL